VNERVALSYPPAEKTLWSEEHHEDRVVSELLLYLIQDVLDDSMFQDGLIRIDSDPVPFYQQFTPLPPQASRPVSAAPPSRPATAAPISSDDISDPELLFDANFQKLAEDLIDSTLANLMSEVDVGEFDMTARSRLIALPSQSRPKSSS
jgi:hypothetical protein